MEEQIITPQLVSAKIKFNYDILVEQFGLKTFTRANIQPREFYQITLFYRT